MANVNRRLLWRLRHNLQLRTCALLYVLSMKIADRRCLLVTNYLLTDEDRVADACAVVLICNAS